MDMKNFDFSKLDPELKAKAEKCQSKEELIELAKSSGVELTDEQLDAIAGGNGDFWEPCGSHSCSEYWSCSSE
ncbi:hypothetical protein BXO88_15255 [Oribacterium sp. C9]|uniref:Nif11-like leader peptide family natural product precursor n=1 Tax=Oribacterium sp. C9 TaxID=1943579 RepID=UPI00098EFDC3|nr:Nif11-like leader peptide family natural product precursor [Oribacterium sp. C9]OON84840.1 hypothetical protein BXO88_15255 [Oribacterium sp. C9]